MSQSSKIQKISQETRIRSQVRAARSVLGWSQGALAERAGISKVALARFEAGKVTTQNQTIARLLEALEAAGVHIIDNDPAGGYTLRVDSRALKPRNLRDDVEAPSE